MEPQFGFRTLPDAVADHIVNLIAVGTLHPGERIFEKDICQQLSVSRIPVREALRTLQSQGVVRSEPNKGTFISHFGSNEMHELMQVRLCIEQIAVRRFLERVKTEPSIVDEMKERIAMLERAALLSDRLAFCQAHLAFHEKIVTLADSPVLKPIWDSLSRGVLVFLMQQESDERYDFDRSVAEHRALLTLLDTEDAPRIENEWGAHILSILNRPAPVPHPDPEPL